MHNDQYQNPHQEAHHDAGSQQFVAPSFVALYLLPGRSRPSATREVIATRYEFCEDLASALVDVADTQRWTLSVSEEAVLERVWRGLAGGQVGVNEAEARWVLQRLAELLNWPVWLLPDAPEPAAGAE